MELNQILDKCTMHGSLVKIEGNLKRDDYVTLKKAFGLVEGKWNRKQGGFVFAHTGENLKLILDSLRNGEKKNLKKEFQFFATPMALASQLVNMADIKEGQSILEPSAGQGAIVAQITRKIGESADIYAFELMETNRMILKNDFPWLFLSNEGDFLKQKAAPMFDRIIANPPFSKNQDIDHVRHMWNMLNTGGRIVTIMSNHWRQGEGRAKEKSFREWLDGRVHEIHEVNEGEFSESGTKIATCILVIDG